MCGGGGGSDDSAEREAQRQAEQDSAIAKINEIFGIYDPNIVTPAVPVTPGDDSSGTYLFSAPTDENPNPVSIVPAVDHRSIADENAAARDALYGQTRDDVIDYFSTDLDDQHDDASKQSRFNLARRGVVGGSNDIDRQSEIADDYNDATIDIANRGDQASTDLQSADEGARLDLINRIRGGLSGDSAITSALDTLQTNADSVQQGAFADALGQVFRDYGSLQLLSAQRSGANKAYSGSGYGTFVNPDPGTYGGKISY